MLHLEEKVESVHAKDTEQAPKDLNNTNTQEANSTEVASEKKESREFISLQKLIEGGVHLGLKPNKWNPKMQEFIYTKKFNHIIDIKKTVALLQRSFNYLVDMVKAGSEIMFVGTKNKMVRESIKTNAQRVNSFYVTQRWLGGTLTNFRHLSHSIKKLNNLEALLANEEKTAGYTKKELGKLSKQKDKLEKFYGGIKDMKKLPSVLVVFDPVEDRNAVLEAKRVGIPIVAVANTNADPELIDFIIPANNFSIRSMYILIHVLTDAVAVGLEKPTVVAYKTAEEIELPEVQRHKRNYPHNPNSTFKRRPYTPYYKKPYRSDSQSFTKTNQANQAQPTTPTEPEKQ